MNVSRRHTKGAAGKRNAAARNPRDRVRFLLSIPRAASQAGTGTNLRPRAAFVTLPALRHLVQTLMFLTCPSTFARTRWRFGNQTRFVALLAWLTLFPNSFALPHTSHR